MADPSTQSLAWVGGLGEAGRGGHVHEAMRRPHEVVAQQGPADLAVLAQPGAARTAASATRIAMRGTAVMIT